MFIIFYVYFVSESVNSPERQRIDRQPYEDKWGEKFIKGPERDRRNYGDRKYMDYSRDRRGRYPRGARGGYYKRTYGDGQDSNNKRTKFVHQGLQEKDVGITEYVNSTKGFSGIIKQR